MSPPGCRLAKGKGLAGPRRANTTAKERALRLLSVRSRSRSELRRRLTQASFEAAEVEEALEDLERVGLVDDDRFAREFVHDRAVLRLAGGRAIRAELLRLGVRGEVVDGALAEVGDEAERARTLAFKKAPRLRELRPEAAYRRLYSLLLRRGYGHNIAAAACTEALGEPAAD
ncbi:MAG TPA: regulatory protein RecX [Actinomycetota bacterium]|nr:regulatory protein RecX [Actinomycetota bacterium]